MNLKLLSLKSIALFGLTMLFMATGVAQNNDPGKVKKASSEEELIYAKYAVAEREKEKKATVANDKTPDVIIKSTNVTPSETEPYGKPVQASEVQIMQNGIKINNQTEIKDASTPYYTVNEMPAYIDGKGELPYHISKTARYPAEARKDKAEGIVVVQVIVEKDGSISNPKIVQSVHPKLDEEALRVIGTLKEFIPGKQNGEPVRCYYQIPVPFVLVK